MSDPLDEEESVGAALMLLQMIRSWFSAETHANVLANALLNACGGDAGRAAAVVMAINAKRRAKPPEIKA